jgi:acid stress-induced BolA-like protein IbaG/YrbA
MEISEIKALVESELPGCRLDVAGEGCNFSMRVVSEAFEGLSPVKRQQKVLAALQSKLATGELHAVTMNVYTPSEWAAQESGSSGLVQIG